jgi:copper(I)-binding protein
MKVEAGETLDLNPLTNHIMLINPRKRLKAGQKVPVTLHFLKSGAIRVEAIVQPYRPASHAGH